MLCLIKRLLEVNEELFCQTFGPIIGDEVFHAGVKFTVQAINVSMLVDADHNTQQEEPTFNDDHTVLVFERLGLQ